MENTQHNLELRSTTIASTKFDEEDKLLQCNAYLGTKFFMAKRIAEQQKEIETLKEQLYYQTSRHTELYDVLKQINEQLQILQRKTKQSDNKLEPEKNEINLSGDLANSFTLEGGDEDNKEKSEKENQLNAVEDQKEKIIESLKNENLSIRKELEIQRTQNIDKNLFCNKVVYEKFILLTELNELVHSLKRIDLNMLNKFYVSQINQINNSEGIFDYSKSNVISDDYYNTISSMGIKYNILSAYSQLTLLMNSVQKDGDFIINSSDNKSKIILNQNENKNSFTENLEKCDGLLNTYEEELNSYVYDLKNVNRPMGFSKKRSEYY